LKITKDCAFLLEEIQKKKERIDSLKIKINENQSETQTLFSTAQGFQQTVAELKLLREKVAHTREKMASLASDMQEYTESDEELIAMRDSFGRRNLGAQDAMREKSAKRKQLSEELAKVRENLGKCIADMGGVEEAKRANERNIARREEVVKEAARRRGFRGMDVIMDDSQIDELKSLLLQSLKEEKGQLDKIKVLLLTFPTNSARLCNPRERPKRSNS
jgi:chromosome segregation ATPase